MAHIVVQFIGITNTDDGDKLAFNGRAYCSGMSATGPSVAFWSTEATPLDVNSTPQAVNDTCVESAIAAVAALGFTVGPGDKRMMFGGPERVS